MRNTPENLITLVENLAGPDLESIREAIADPAAAVALWRSCEPVGQPISLETGEYDERGDRIEEPVTDAELIDALESLDSFDYADSEVA